MILEQIRQLSPATYQDADDLVHFVSAGNVDLEPGSRKLDEPDFARLEERLRAFVLGNRTKSKLLPAKNYLVNLLLDIGVLSEANQADAASKHKDASETLEHDMPAYEQLLRARDRMEKQVQRLAEGTVMAIQQQTADRLKGAADHVENALQPLAYPGFLLIWQYAQDLCESMAQAMVQDILGAEQQARDDSQQCLDKLHRMAQDELGDFPRVASVDSMFVRPRDRRLVIDVETTDFFDFVVDDKLSGCVLSMGAAAMVGGRMMGFKDAVSSLWNMSSMVGAHNLRRFALPVLGLAGASVFVYVVADMRNAVERKLVRKFKQAVRDTGYIDAHALRIGRGARKVFRVEGYEIHSRVQKAIEAKEQKRNDLELLIHSSQESMAYFTSLLEKSTALLDKVEAVHIDQSRIEESLKI
jgi:mitofusin